MIVFKLYQPGLILMEKSVDSTLLLDTHALEVFMTIGTASHSFASQSAIQMEEEVSSHFVMSWINFSQSILLSC